MIFEMMHDKKSQALFLYPKQLCPTAKCLLSLSPALFPRLSLKMASPYFLWSEKSTVPPSENANTPTHKHTNTQIQTHNYKCTTTVLIFYGMKSAQRLLSTKTFGKGTFLQFLSSGLSKGSECFITASNHQNHYSFKSTTLS